MDNGCWLMFLGETNNVCVFSHMCSYFVSQMFRLQLLKPTQCRVRLDYLVEPELAQEKVI